MVKYGEGNRLSKDSAGQRYADGSTLYVIPHVDSPDHQVVHWSRLCMNRGSSGLRADRKVANHSWLVSHIKGRLPKASVQHVSVKVINKETCGRVRSVASR